VPNILVRIFNQTWSFSVEFHNRTESQSSWKSVLLGRQKYMRTDENKDGQKRKEKLGKQEECLILINKEET
jgi:hypothetical protein